MCPTCGKNPRRAPGQRCHSCFLEWQRNRRKARAAGAPKKHLVPAESERVFDRDLKKKVLFITSAQNATPVHQAFLNTLQIAAKHRGGEVVVIPLRYKNPTSIWSDKQDSDDWWAPEVVPFLCNQRKELNKNLVLVGDIKIQPTATSPLSGFEALTGAESCIIGHPRMQFRSVSVPSGRYPKILSTTGICTQPNFTDTKAGKLGDFHHFLGAVVVEIDGNTFHLRQIEAHRKTGEFTDRRWHYTVKGVQNAKPALGLVLGDSHARFNSKAVDVATFGKGGIVEELNPQTIVFHDVLDGYAVNPHHHGNPFISQAKYRGKVGNVREEVEHAVGFIKKRVNGRKGVVVASNHDDFLSRWVISSDWKSNPVNAEFYLETALAMLRSVKLTEKGSEHADPFVHWVEKLKGDANIRCLGPDESFEIADIECSLHGHRGPNGARGSLKNLSRLGVKVITAHAHTPGIEGGNYQVGTSTPLRLEYTGGASSWLNSHAVVYASGARSIITVIDGKWRR